MAESDLLEYALLDRESSDFGGFITYGANPAFPCSLGAIGFMGRLVSGGISEGQEVTVVIRKSVLPANVNPKANDQLTLTDNKEVSYALKVASDGITDMIYALQIICNAQNQNA